MANIDLRVYHQSLREQIDDNSNVLNDEGIMYYRENVAVSNRLDFLSNSVRICSGDITWIES